jgi:hypothetical protein
MGNIFTAFAGKNEFFACKIMEKGKIEEKRPLKNNRKKRLLGLKKISLSSELIVF